ncbi:transcriptional regulator TbsP [Halococcoides cellulosivorans]|uniref:Transcriptional regulator n=1 Tax=Halococcoides cellulosivorans TaxID=1679096 RepID=A0A2R4X1F4_9EURY|nr:DUF5821 family protein [Halococcoides cellulosivorans]AWB27621.1 hypothetical protein HARCEL1_07815 [Halococcoides cellulosivorans]
MATETLLEGATDEVLSAAIDATDDVFVVNPSRETIRELMSVLDGTVDPPSVRLFVAERPLKDVMDDFLVASRAADLSVDDRLTIKILDEPPMNSLVVTDDRVVSITAVGDQFAGIQTATDAFVDHTWSYYSDRWDAAEEYSLRTPPLTRVRESLSADISADTAEDFDAVLDSLQTARGDGDGLDEVTISLLAAAKNGELLYDISKWGEDVGLASKATFSRTKTQLEDMGLIDTEKVPIDVGRPRLRLMVGDDRLERAESNELASVAQSLLSSGS